MMKQNRIHLLICALSFSLVWGCARIPLREISDARVLMEAAKSSCSRVYMSEEMNEVNKSFALIDKGMQKKSRKSKKELRRLALEVQSISKKMITETAGIKTEIYSQIQQEIVSAIKKIHEGEKAEANRYARKEYKLAIQSVREARQISQDECRYKEALEKAGESFQYAEQSIQRAAAFKRELENKLPVYHIVKEGETLKSIAKSSPLYRDEAYSEVIYKANRDQIGDPGILYPGQQLYLPGKEEIKKNDQ
jgi:nucleoid-associated protein YgaU